MCIVVCVLLCFFFFKQKTAYEMRISDWSSDVCSSDLLLDACPARLARHAYSHRVGAGLAAADGDAVRSARPRQHRAARLRGDRRSAFSRDRALPRLDCRGRRAPGAAQRRKRSGGRSLRSEEHTSELQSLMRNSYAVFCSQKKTNTNITQPHYPRITKCH